MSNVFIPMSNVFIPDHQHFRDHHPTKDSIQYAGWISPKGEFHEGPGHASILGDIYDVSRSVASEDDTYYTLAFKSGYFRCVGSRSTSRVRFYIETSGKMVQNFEQFARLITHSQRAAIRAIYSHFEYLAKRTEANFVMEIAVDGRDDSAREYHSEYELNQLFDEIDNYRNLYPV